MLFLRDYISDKLEFAGDANTVCALNIIIISWATVREAHLHGQLSTCGTELQATSFTSCCGWFGLTRIGAEHKLTERCSNQVPVLGVNPKSKFSSAMQKMLYIFFSSSRFISFNEKQLHK